MYLYNLGSLAGILQQPGVQVRKSEFRTDEFFVQSHVEFVRHAFCRRVLDGETGLFGERTGRAKRAGNTRSIFYKSILRSLIVTIVNPLFPVAIIVRDNIFCCRFGTSYAPSDACGKEILTRLYRSR